ncbi:hypothetical protein [Kitasatospora sp. HPMI-4]|uniref:hypothetical protein n=1 Tax=Kitasatospora sp. HPMI-4 TaxID=3448443 RepID=UPI003F1DA4A7
MEPEPHARLLLLLPVLGDADLSTDATETVAGALAAIGTPPEATAALAEALLDHPFWDGKTCRTGGLPGTTAQDWSRQHESRRSMTCGFSLERATRIELAL